MQAWKPGIMRGFCNTSPDAPTGEVTCTSFPTTTWRRSTRPAPADRLRRLARPAAGQRRDHPPLPAGRVRDLRVRRRHGRPDRGARAGDRRRPAPAGPITTLRAAAELAGIEPDVDQADQFDVPAPGDLDEPLHVGEAASADLARWYAFVTRVLETLRAEAAEADDASPVRIWPEHFDAAIDLGAEAEGCGRPTAAPRPTDNTRSRTSTRRRGADGSIRSSATHRSRRRR